MAKVNTDAWQKQFMSLTLFTVVIINIMVAVFQVMISRKEKINNMQFYDFSLKSEFHEKI